MLIIGAEAALPAGGAWRVSVSVARPGRVLLRSLHACAGGGGSTAIHGSAKWVDIAADVCFILITDCKRNPRMLEANQDRFPSTLQPITHRALSAFFFFFNI